MARDFPWINVLMLGAAISLIALLVSLASLNRRTRQAAGACGKCAYNVRGLPGAICPECGSDLRIVGITTTSTQGPLTSLVQAVASAWKRMLIFTLLLVALTAAITIGALMYISSHRVTPIHEVTLTPASKAYRVEMVTVGRELRVSGSMGVKSAPYTAANMSIRLGSPGGVIDRSTDLEIALPSWSSSILHWVGDRAVTQPVAPFTRKQLIKLFEENQIDVARPDVSAEIDAIMLMIEAARQRPADQIAGSSKHFSVDSSQNRTDSFYAGPEPLGPPAFTIGSTLWMLMMTAMVIGRMGRPALRNSLRFLMPGASNSSDAARTVTVMFSDIKDYTARSAQTGRTGAIELVRRHRDIATPIIQERHGVIVKTIGDALLVTFDSATDAALAALEIQEAVAATNPAVAESSRIHLRIAVACGEVIVESGDVYGETVNLASRLQGVAKAGEVLLSDAARAVINGREVIVEEYGEFQLAGFAQKILAYRALRPTSSVPAPLV